MQNITCIIERHRVALENLLQPSVRTNSTALLPIPSNDRALKSKDNPDIPKPLCVRINVAAQMLGIGRTKMYELIKADEIDTIKIGKSTMVTTASLENMVYRRARKNKL